MSTSNLKRLLEHMDISNAALARSINVDASLISRWMSGQRQLKLASEINDKLAAYLMNKLVKTNSTNWFKRQIELDGFVCDCDVPDHLHKQLRFWLSSDGDTVGQAMDLLAKADRINPSLERDRVITGLPEITAFLDKALESLADSSSMDIHLSNEVTNLLGYQPISQLLHNSMLNKNMTIRLIISMSSDIKAVSQLICQYMQPIIAGLLSVSVLHGAVPGITNQTTFIVQKEMALIVFETLRNMAPPIGTLTYDADFIKESQKSFEHAHKSSQPLLQRYNDNAARGVIDIFYDELSLPGGLDVIKDSINPIYMAAEAHGAFVKTLGYKGEQLRWRREQMALYKKGMHDNLDNGTVFREMISLKRLNQIVEDGVCKMPALYFFGVGIAYLGAEGCLSILEGYRDYLNKYPNFHLIILDEIPELSERSCWHIKQNSHWMLNGWSNDEHIILYTVQLMLTHEFQSLYNGIWSHANYSEGRRTQTLSILEDSITRMKTRHHL
ncbi:MAG: helix-turn-helix domain-containing protein [Peptococcaceae bacterium]|nr:helix-turn-helix domain-containing protein [Peptococcaceae bacterium]